MLVAIVVLPALAVGAAARQANVARILATGGQTTSWTTTEGTHISLTSYEAVLQPAAAAPAPRPPLVAHLQGQCPSSQR